MPVFLISAVRRSFSPSVQCSFSISWCSETPIKPSVHRRASDFPATAIPIIWSDATGIRRKIMDGVTRSRQLTRPSRHPPWPRNSAKRKWW